ncbi:MAG: hypothetical protein A2162_06440 [Deltaproteobacteria bacterium RBG_13_52_11b]|nr:MAG: hypothetical protein A2162_06440 [Deltaproteobacteria bacterium RBG_13_52_11b]
MERLKAHRWFLMLMVLIVSVLFVSPALAQKQEKITLRIVYEQPITDRGHSLFKVWQEKVNAINPQRLHIQYLGAFEVIPTFEQVAALRKGTVDMVVAAPTFYSGLLPDAMAIQCMGAAVTVPESRKKGMVALQDEIHRKKLGITLLGGLWGGDHHVILIKKPVPKADLSGLKIRAIPVQQPAVKSVGGAVTVIPPEETYTALQSGLLDGVACPSVLVPDYKYAEVAKYIFYPLIPMSSWVPVLMRADQWDGLPPDVKKMIMDPLLQMEPQVDSFFGKMENDIIDNFLKKGLKKTGASTKAENAEVTKKMVKAQWKAFVEDRADPAWLPKLNAIGKPALGID